MRRLAGGLVALVACGSPVDVRAPVPDTRPDTGTDLPDSGGVMGPCPAEMVLVGAACIDRYEAPNVAGARPLVMYTLPEAAAWCAARGKQLCRDDVWVAACAGDAGAAYPYGDAHQPGVCRDDAVWRAYNQGLLSRWPPSASAPDVASYDELIARAAAIDAAAAEHVDALYQADVSGAREGCGGAYGVYDLAGNIEEWTLRADGGAPNFRGNLKGRYWAETRTCQANITTHADGFRFYEIGFRCCAEPQVAGAR